MVTSLLHKISELIDSHFDTIITNFLGIIPGLEDDAELEGSGNSLVDLFLKIMGEEPNKQEEDALKSLLIIANGYMEALKERTKTKSIQDVNAYITNTKSKLQTVKIKEIKELVSKNLNQAENQVNLIVSAESNKVTNTSMGLKIVKIASNLDDSDPVVGFNVTRDDVTGPYEYILHLLPDRVTPRLWKLSEISHNYYKNGDQYPSMSGLHVHCRCRLFYLPKGYGFDSSGNIKFISLNHDEFKIQRAKYGLPSVPAKISRSKKTK